MMKSGLIDSFVRHQRYFPREYKFNYRFFWCLFDLDELDLLAERTWCFSRNKFNLFSFYDRDHMYRGHKTLKENVLDYMKSMGVTEKVLNIQLLANARILGYVFNPVSFYFIQTENSPYVIIQIGNTFSELKPYLVDKTHLKDGVWTFRTIKEFYISPFISLDNEMTFKISHKGKSVSVLIDDMTSEGRTELKASYQGTIREWSARKLMGYFFRFPLMSFRIIAAIHYHALKLYLMKIPLFRKHENLHRETGVYQWKQGYYHKKDS